MLKGFESCFKTDRLNSGFQTAVLHEIIMLHLRIFAELTVNIAICLIFAEWLCYYIPFIENVGELFALTLDV